jgi:hypothetical protein
MLKHSGNAARLGADSPEVEVFAGGAGVRPRSRSFCVGAGVRPRSRSFCCEKLYFGARPVGLFGDGEDEGGEGGDHRGYSNPNKGFKSSSL